MILNVRDYAVQNTTPKQRARVFRKAAEVIQRDLCKSGRVWGANGMCALIADVTYREGSSDLQIECMERMRAVFGKKHSGYYWYPMMNPERRPRNWLQRAIMPRLIALETLALIEEGYIPDPTKTEGRS